MISVVLAAAALATSACSPGDSVVEQPAGDAAPGHVVRLTDFMLGTDTNPQGVVHESEHAYRFVTGMVVYYSMKIEEAPATARVTVVWGDNQDAVQHREEKVVGQEKSLAFMADTTDWPAGHYTVEAWVDDERLDVQIFEVADV